MADATLAQVFGSSPRARGTPGARPRHGRRDRFIPACAGNTPGDRDARPLDSVHPRVRGEHPALGSSGSFGSGSSPRARGTRLLRKLTSEPVRFIPACAGNTLSTVDLQIPGTVHPRVRGEHLPQPSSGLRDLGSSPRARGTRWRRRFGPGHARFIPACAGNTRAAALAR